MVGWLCAVAWQVWLAGICFMVGSIVQGLIALNVESYVWHNWHGTLLTIAAVLLAIIFNTVLAAYLPILEGSALVLHLAGLFAIIIPLWVMGPKADAHETLLEFTNVGGWPSDGLAAMIGLTTPLSMMMGFDCSVHMCEFDNIPTVKHSILTNNAIETAEEIQDASLVLPKAIIWSVVLNAVLGFLMAITLIFTIGDVDNILATKTGQPFIQVFFNATDSYAGTNAMCALVVILLWLCCVSELATASRQLWSFARDRGLPASDWLATVSYPFLISYSANMLDKIWY